MMPRRRFAELRTAEIAHCLRPSSVLIQPIAAVEQHGPHLPLSTDLIVAEATVDAVVAERGDELDLWVLPPLAYGKSDEHAWAPGTVWLSATTLLSVLGDVGRSLSTLPTRRLAFVNGHGGNTQLLNVANRELRREYGLLTFLLHPSVPRVTPAGPTRSAWTWTPSSGWASTPDGTRRHCCCTCGPNWLTCRWRSRPCPPPWPPTRMCALAAPSASGGCPPTSTPPGVIGDPTAASAERGKRLFNAMVANLGDALAEVAAFRFPNGD